MSVTEMIETWSGVPLDPIKKAEWYRARGAQTLVVSEGGARDPLTNETRRFRAITGHLVIGLRFAEDGGFSPAGCDAWRAKRAVDEMVFNFRTGRPYREFLDVLLDNGQRVRIRPKPRKEPTP